jgi:CheY-like chemotaxis protein
VAKILVADDNSNIQKMVGLALKDQGIDVVAVGNGEAAVRKISDVRPDLVLADVFMPVRNGYEVCKYVKGDSSLSHIPVILLVGAFDPLDEEEAQRVGADGVLKKPFVPPDPLISMVKSALVRASTGQLNVPKPSTKEGSSATVTSLPGAETLAAVPTQAVPEPEAEPVSSRPPDLKIEPGTQAPAFGSLLEPAPSPSETGDYTNFTTPNRELLERDWGANQEEEEEEEEELNASWRPDAATEAFGDEGQPGAKKPERKKRETWTPTREKKQDLLETADQPEFVSEPIPAKPPATKPSVPAPPSAPPVTPPVTAKPPAASALPVPPPPPVAPLTPVAVKPPAAALKAPTPATQPKPWVEMPAAKPVPPTVPPVQAAPTAPPKQAAPPPKPAAPKEPEKAPGDSWFSVSSTPWGTDSKKPGQGAPAWDAVTPAATPPAKPSVQPSASAKAPEVAQPVVSETPELEPEPQATGFYTESVTLPELVSGGENVSPAVVEQLRQEATQVVEESALVEPSPEYTLPTPEALAPAASTDMDALVAKVLAKLSPEVLQAVTREILKPVVEAMVREEIKAKKS